MKAELLLDERHILAEDAFIEIVVWRLPRPARGSKHRYKYRLALIEKGACVLRYDNEAGKGDHRHAGGREFACEFVGLDRLIEEFRAEVRARREK